MVIDTHKNPLKDPDFGCDTAEMGVYKLYHQFLTGSVRIVSPRARRYLLNVARRDDSYVHQSEVLERTVAASLRQRLAGEFEVCEVVRGEPSFVRVHQLADVLLGAVTHRYNPRASAHKAAIRAHVEGRVGRSLARNFMPNERPFNVWHFAGKGRDRWAPGAAGIV
jgi:hypothetical protein